MGRQAVPDHCIDKLIGHQMPLGNGSLHLRTKLGVMLDVPSEDVTHTHVLKLEILRQQLGLGALTAALYTHNDELAHWVSACLLLSVENDRSSSQRNG